MQGISEAAFSFANFVGPILGSHVATSGWGTSIVHRPSSICWKCKALWAFALRGGFEGLRLTMLGLVVAEVLLLCVGFSRQGRRPRGRDFHCFTLSDPGLVPGTEL